MSLRERSILSLQDLTLEETEQLLTRAAGFREDGIAPTLPGRRICGLFFNPSLRTRTSLEIAARSLGAQSLCYDVGGMWPLELEDGAVMDGDKIEHVRDAIGKFLSGVVDLIAVRSFPDLGRPYAEAGADALVQAVEEAAEVPVLNLESALFHPMQGLADLFTLRNHLEGDPSDHTIALTWAYHPKPLPMAVTNTALLAFCRAGYRVRLVHPPGFDLDPDVMACAHELGGDRLSRHTDMDEGLRDARVIYAKSWASHASYGNLEEDARQRALHKDWIVNEERQAAADPGAFMHCLPVRRNVVVSDGVLDGPHSWVAEQARSRVLVQAAVLHEVLA